MVKAKTKESHITRLHKLVQYGLMVGFVFGGVILFILLFAVLVAMWALFYVFSVLYTWVQLLVIFYRKEKIWRQNSSNKKAKETPE
jgi:predicted tellurium resistance membrane protein TerC